MLRVPVVLSNALLERLVRLSLEHPERVELGEGNIFVFKGGKVESLMLLERVVRDDLGFMTNRDRSRIKRVKIRAETDKEEKSTIPWHSSKDADPPFLSS